MNNPLVSIIIPTFNRAQLIGETLDSVFAQTYENWECIIVDDGSTDNTENVVSEYVKKDSRFQFMKRAMDTIKGAPTCRNIGLFNSTGFYVIFLDSDDVLLIECLYFRVLEFERYSNDDFLVFPMALKIEGVISKKEIITSDNYLIDFLYYNLPWSIMCPIWKKDFLIKIKGFREGYLRLNDPELMIRALLVNNVKYKVFNNANFDTVYNCSVTNWVLMRDKYYQSLLLFIPDICNELEINNKSYLKYRLRGYLKVWFRDFMFPSNKNLLKENKMLILLFYKKGINSLFKTVWLTLIYSFYIILTYLGRFMKNKVIEIT